VDVIHSAGFHEAQKTRLWLRSYSRDHELLPQQSPRLNTFIMEMERSAVTFLGGIIAWQRVAREVVFLVVLLG